MWALIFKTYLLLHVELLLGRRAEIGKEIIK